MQPSPLIARSEELSRIAAAWERLHSGAGPVAVALVGEAGIGKTRLLREAVAAIGPSVLLFGTARADGAAPHDWFASAAAELDAPEGTDERLWRVLRQEPTGTPVRLPDGALLRGAMRTLRRLAGAGPALIAVDDLHWLDPESLALWSEMAAARDFPAMLLAAGRSAEESRHPAAAARTLARLGGTREGVTIALRPFTIADTGAFMGAHSGGPVAHAEARAVHRRTGGNPFWVNELAVGAAATAPLPGHLAALVRARLAGEDADAWRLARGLALLGESVDNAVAADVLGAPLLEGALPRLIAAGVLQPAGTELRFPHALIREAFGATALPEEARAIHRAALADAQRRGDEPAVAAHARAVGETALAVAAAARTARRQLDSWLTESAQRTAEDALASAPDHLDLLETAALAALLSEDFTAARTHFERLAVGGPPERRCIAHLRLAEVAWHQGRIEDQWRSLERAEALAAPGSVERARYLTGRAMACVRAEAYEEIPALCDEAEPLYDRYGLASQRRSAAISRATALHYLGDTPTAVRILREVWRDAEAAGDLRKLSRAVNNLLAINLCDLPEAQARRLFEQGVASVGDLGMAVWGGKLSRVGADAAMVAGDLGRAWELLRARVRDEPDPHERAVLAAKAGLLAVERDDLDEAERLCHEALALVVGMDQGWVVTYPHWLAVAVAARRGGRSGVEAAMRAYRDAVGPDLHRHREERVLEVARLGVEQGVDPDATQRFLTECLGFAPTPGGGSDADLLWMTVRASQGDWAGVLARIEGAAGHVMPAWRSIAHGLAAEAGERLGDREAALAHAGQAVALLERWPGWRRDAARAKLRSLEDVPLTAALTAREGEVLRAAAEGRSNRQIAAALGISQRTVEVHMSRLLAKTASVSRTELVARFLQRR